jgi:hypothetical protein
MQRGQNFLCVAFCNLEIGTGQDGFNAPRLGLSCAYICLILMLRELCLQQTIASCVVGYQANDASHLKYRSLWQTKPVLTLVQPQSWPVLWALDSTHAITRLRLYTPRDRLADRILDNRKRRNNMGIVSAAKEDDLRLSRNPRPKTRCIAMPLERRSAQGLGSGV